MRINAAALHLAVAASSSLVGAASAFAFSSPPSAKSTSTSLGVSSHPNPSMLADDTSATNEADFLNNFLGAAGPSDPYKPRPQEPLEPWGVVSDSRETLAKEEEAPVAAVETVEAVETAAEIAPFFAAEPEAKAEITVETEEEEEQEEEDLSSQSRYLDSHGAAYVDSLAEGRKRNKELEEELEQSSAVAATAVASVAPVNGDAPYVNGDAPNGSYVNGGGYVNGNPEVVELPGFVQTASASAIATAVATTAADLATAASDDPTETISRLTALLASRDSELAALREEHRAVKAAASDLLGKYYELAEGLEEVETALMKCADKFPDPDEGGFESYEWLLNR